MANTLIRYPGVTALTGYSQPTIKRRVKERLLPKPIKIGVRAVAFSEAEISAVNAARIAGKGDDEIRQLVAEMERQRTTATA